MKYIFSEFKNEIAARITCKLHTETTETAPAGYQTQDLSHLNFVHATNISKLLTDYQIQAH